jgi:hypothetical protein
MTSSGAPINGVNVGFCARVCLSAYTDANGEAEFADFPADIDVDVAVLDASSALADALDARLSGRR